MPEERFHEGQFRRPSVRPLEQAIAEQRWLDSVEAGLARWTKAADHVSVEDWQKAMRNVKPRHVKISRRRRLALKWSGWTYKHIWSHCPRYHADDE